MRISADSRIIAYKVTATELRKVVRAARTLFGPSVVIRVSGFFKLNDKFFDLSKAPTQISVDETLRAKDSTFALQIFDDKLTYAKCLSIHVVVIESILASPR